MTAADELGAFLEALLFIAERPLTSAELAELSGIPPARAEAALATLGTDALPTSCHWLIKSRPYV